MCAGEFKFVEEGAEKANTKLIETRRFGTLDRAVNVAGHQESNEEAPRESSRALWSIKEATRERRGSAERVIESVAEPQGTNEGAPRESSRAPKGLKSYRIQEDYSRRG